MPEHFGLRRPLQVTEALDRHLLHWEDLRALAPVLFGAASDGDAVARAIVDRQADEIVAMAVAALGRARLLRSAVPVVLAGGIFRTPDRAFHDRIATGLAARASHAEIRRLTSPPVIGAILLGLDALADASSTDRADAEARVRGLVDGAVRRVGPAAERRITRPIRRGLPAPVSMEADPHAASRTLDEIRGER